MTIETHIVQGERKFVEYTEEGEFYGSRNESDVAHDLSQRYTEIVAEGGRVIASHTLLNPKAEQTLYLVVDYPPQEA